MKIVVNVTQKDIDEGHQFEPDTCPVARSLARRFVGSPRVGTATVSFDGGGVMRLPDHAIDFIRTFDFHKKKARPFRFTVDPPPGCKLKAKHRGAK